MSAKNYDKTTIKILISTGFLSERQRTLFLSEMAGEEYPYFCIILDQ